MIDFEIGGNVAPDEPVARFILQNRWLNKVDNTVKHLAFHPLTVGGQTALSTCRISGLNDNDIKETGASVAIPPKKLYGYATLDAQVYFDNKLRLFTDNNPYNGHTNVFGWPEEKSDRKAVSQELARRARFERIIE